MRKNGFTLIELVIVIVLLGILAVTALPRFVDLSSESTAATLRGLAGSMRSANNIVYAKAAIHNLTHNETAVLSLDSTNQVSLRYGYFAYDPAQSLRTTAGQQLTDALNISVCHHMQSDTDCGSADWRFDIDNNGIKLYHRNIGPNPTASNGGTEPLCYVEYRMAADAVTPPQYLVQTSEC